MSLRGRADNVHYQHSAVLAADLVNAGLPFEMMAYTDNDHRINTGANTQRDLYGRITRFLLEDARSDDDDEL
jgi:dipeptidyl aminopeptidase/acylaminoacyl peptidase